MVGLCHGQHARMGRRMGVGNAQGHLPPVGMVQGNATAPPNDDGTGGGLGHRKDVCAPLRQYIDPPLRCIKKARVQDTVGQAAGGRE